MNEKVTVIYNGTKLPPNTQKAELNPFQQGLLTAALELEQEIALTLHINSQAPEQINIIPEGEEEPGYLVLNFPQVGRVVVVVFEGGGCQANILTTARETIDLVVYKIEERRRQERLEKILTVFALLIGVIFITIGILSPQPEIKPILYFVGFVPLLAVIFKLLLTVWQTVQRRQKRIR